MLFSIHRDRTFICRLLLIVGVAIGSLVTEPNGGYGNEETKRSAVVPSADELQEIPAGRVLIQISEGLPAEDRWPTDAEGWPRESVRWLGDEFLLSRVPQQFDEWGIRDAWNAPLLLRMVADVDLPVGRQRFLLRARALGRLWVDGQLVASTQPITAKPPDGEEPVTPIAEPPLPGHRAAGYRQQEVFGETMVVSDTSDASRRCRVMLELVVGGKDQRTETGEICVALFASDGDVLHVLGGGKSRLPLTDTAVVTARQRIEKSLASFDDDRRRRAAASQHSYWSGRHEYARQWVLRERKDHPAGPHASRADDKPQHPIDAFVAAKIERASAEFSAASSGDAGPEHESVVSILRQHCFRCHGEKDQGGLTLDSREAALVGGDSGIPAVVPGDLEASELVARIRSDDDGLRMPPTGDRLGEDQIEVLARWVESGAVWPASTETDSRLSAADLARTPVIDDAAFLRRILFDTVGVPPTVREVEAFVGSSESMRREALIDELISDDRFADHWMSFWLDLLAENPTLINASLNSTGPFRWFLYDSLRDNKPLDQMVTELILLRGGVAEGGSAGFGVAGENDAPLAAKGHIVASAFLGIELQCARCHDSPYHSTTQRDLYSVAAMFERAPVTVPGTSRVPAAFFEANQSRQSLIRATLDPDEAVRPEWPFAAVTGVTDDSDIEALLRRRDDTRERLAVLITAPQNQRFTRVIVNRVWKRLIGAGFVEPVDDWEGHLASHPDLLDWLAHEFVLQGYDLRQLVRLIVSSETYQREAAGKNLEASPSQRFFNAPERRRLSAEQVVDALHVAVGQPIDVEELTFVHDGRRPLGKRQTLGHPSRAWMFADLNNERDRPSLSLPRARAVVDVLEAFGWTGARQTPITDRETEPNVLQPGILANGALSVILTRASSGSELAELAITSESPESLVESLFLRTLTRLPRPAERDLYSRALADQFDTRLVPHEDVTWPTPPDPLPKVTWFNHLRPQANEIQQELERRVRQGPAPDPRLRADWRELYEDTVWSLINHREFVWLP